MSYHAEYFSDLVFHICADQLRAFLMVWRSIFLWDNQGRWLMAGFCCRLAGLINARARDLRGIIPEGHPPLPSLIIWQHPWPAQMILGFLKILKDSWNIENIFGLRFMGCTASTINLRKCFFNSCWIIYTWRVFTRIQSESNSMVWSWRVLYVYE